MHDLMHDLAKDVSDESAIIEKLIEPKAYVEHVRHMQIGPGVKQISGVLKGTRYLRTFLIPLSLHGHLEELNLMSLRALRCDSHSITNSQVVNAKHLRYLDFSSSDIVRLPESICILYYLQSLTLTDCSKLRYLPDGMGAMRKLIHLNLLGCNSLERMPPNIGQLNNLHTLTKFIVGTEAGHGIEELKDLCHLGNRLELCNLKNIKSGSNAKEANLHLKQNVGELFMHWGPEEPRMPGDEVSNEELVLESLSPHSKLKTLEVHGYNGLEISQWMRDPGMFRCLRKLTVSHCPWCKDLPIVWLSVSLEYLRVANMDSLTTLCKSIDGQARGYDTCLQYFPKLKEMSLSCLSSLERWTENSAGHPNSLIMFPVLERISLWSCPKLPSVPVCPVLENLAIWQCCSVPISSFLHLTVLSMLEWDGTGIIPQSMPLDSWSSVVRLTVRSLANRSFGTLQNLSLNDPTSFVPTSGLSKSLLGFPEWFSSVEDLEFLQCEEFVHWPVEELRSFARLRTLSILFCDDLEGNCSSSEETLLLPQLERLLISTCDSLLEIPKLPVSLETLAIHECNRLVALPSNLGDLAKLTYLNVARCAGLKELPDGMDGLTSLERLAIEACPGIEEFPHGLLERLPALKLLRIAECPKLQRRCREGGEYFHLVSSIPNKQIPEAESQHEETGSSMKKLVRRLLPSCADS